MIQHDPVARARQAWGDDAPAWVLGLAQACAEASQSQVAKRLGKSAPLISQVIGNKYPGDLDAIRDQYLGVYENGMVDCPALGSVRVDKCRMWQGHARNHSPVNALRVSMFRACNRCNRFKGDAP